MTLLNKIVQLLLVMATLLIQPFCMAQAPTIDSFDPSNAGTGTTVNIIGANFSGATSVSFGGTEASSFNVVSPTSIIAIVASGSSGSVSVTTPGGTGTKLGFSFVPAPTITSFTPLNAGAGTDVVITGTNFNSTISVSFGGVDASYFVINSTTTITARISTTGASGNIIVTSVGGSAIISGFNFIPTPLITSFEPQSGFVGTEVIITGDNFSTTKSTPLTEELLTGGSSKTWKLKPSSGAIGVGPEKESQLYWPNGVNISGDRPCQFNDEFIFKTAGVYEYKSIGDIYAEPYMGLTEGCKNETDLSGTSPDASAWGSGTHAFTFTAATEATPALITVTGTGAFIGLPKAFNGGEYTTAPPTTNGSVTYEVLEYLNDGVNESLLLSIDVSNDGSLFWNFLLSKNGENVYIPPPNIVKINSTEASIINTPTATSITAVVSDGTTNGKISVQVEDQISTSTDNFTLIPSPYISMVSNGTERAGGTIILTGTNFVEVSSVKFGGTDAASFTVVNSTEISATLDLGSPGDITVTTPAGTATYTGFDFLPLPTITSFSPTSGPIGSQVTINGEVFADDFYSFGNTVTFNGIETNIISLSTTSMVVSIPQNATSGKIALNINNYTVSSVDNFIVTPLIYEDFPTTYNTGEDLVITLNVDYLANVKSVFFHSKGISQDDQSWVIEEIFAINNQFKVIVPTSSIPYIIGMEYYFTVNHYDDSQQQSSIGRSYLYYYSENSEQNIPNMSYGDQLANYQIVAIPMELDYNEVSSVFTHLGEYDPKYWRLFDYNNGENREYNGFNTIEPGKGYWLIVRNETDINPGTGTTVKVNANSPFTMEIYSGWNLIGNPYNFKILWEDVLNYNNNPSGIGNLKTFAGGVLTENTTLDRYRGAFVYSDVPTATTINIPTTRNTTIGGGRIEEGEAISSDLGESKWELLLSLAQGQLKNQLGGIGMHPEATIKGKDKFDQVSLPMLSGLGFFELGFNHPENNNRYNKDIVPTLENYTWEVDVIRDNNIPITLHWNNNSFGENSNELYLYNPTTLQIVDMRAQNKFIIGATTHKLQIIFGKIDYVNQQLNNEFPLVGEFYPNPTESKVHLPIKVNNENSVIEYSIYDMTGKLIEFKSVRYPIGIHEMTLEFDKEGMFIVQLRLDDTMVSKKLIVH